MYLSGRILNAVAGVNIFTTQDFLQVSEGFSGSIFIQLVDKSLDTKDFNPPGRRYVADNGATLEVTIPSINGAKTLVKTATQPYSTDKSIWSFTIGTTDVLSGDLPLYLKLVEGTKTTKGSIPLAIRVQAQNNSFC